MGLEIRAWLALHASCSPDDLRFAGTDARGVNSVILYFTLDDKPGYRVQFTERAAVGGRRHWELTADWPTGSTRTTVDEKPAW